MSNLMKDIRRSAAETRTKERALRNTSEQLEALDDRVGPEGAKRERARLLAKAEAEFLKAVAEAQARPAKPKKGKTKS